MALLKFKSGLAANLVNKAVEDGVVYITTDSQEMKVDIGGKRIAISDFVIADSITPAVSGTDEGAGYLLIGGKKITEYHNNLFYYVKGETFLRRYIEIKSNGPEADGTVVWFKIGDTAELDAAIISLGNRLDTAEGNIESLTDRATSLETAVSGINASTVETTTSFKVTTAVGNYKVGDTVQKDDIQKIIMDMLSKDVYPTRTENASASITLTGAGAKEVGTEFTPQFSFSTKGGKYNANGVEQAANVTYNTFSVTESGRPDGATAGTSTSSSGSFAKFTVTDDTNYKLTGSCKSTQGDIPKTYLGSDYDVDDTSIDVRINAKDWNDLNSSAVTGYRGCFYGYYSEKKLTPTALTSAQVRSLCTSAKSTLAGFLTYDNTNKYYYVTTNKMQQMFFAAPKGKYSTVAVANSTNGAPQTVTKITDVMVEGLNGYTTAAYDVWYVDNAGAESGETKFKVTIS